MATTTNISSSYAGKDAGMYISLAMKESKTLAALTIMENVNQPKIHIYSYRNNKKA